MTYVSPFEEIQKIATKIKNKASGFVNKTVVPAVSKAASSFYDNKGYFQQGRFTTQPLNKPIVNAVKPQVTGFWQGLNAAPDAPYIKNPNSGYSIGRSIGGGALTPMTAPVVAPIKFAGNLLSKFPSTLRLAQEWGPANEIYRRNQENTERRIATDPIYKKNPYLADAQRVADNFIVGGIMAGPSALGYGNAKGKFSALADKKPRFEISDRQASLKKISGVVKDGITRLENILDHKGLFKQYPNLKRLRVAFEEGGANINQRGSFDPRTFQITIDPRLPRGEMRSTLLHEVQHAIQNIEGFAKGGTPNQFVPIITDNFSNLIKQKRESFKKYQSLAGEIEARDVQAREALSPQQRRYKQPYSSQGIPLKDQIVRFDDSVAGSVNPPKPQGVIPKESSLPASTSQNINPAIVQNQLGKARQKPVLTQNSIVPGQGTESTVATGVSSSTSDYIKELTVKQNKAGSSGPVRGGLVGKIKNFMSEVKEKFVDSTAPIEDAVTLAEKKGKYKVLPREDVRLQIDKVLRSKTLASQFAEDNGLVQAIKDAPDINALDQYMIAKQSQRVEQLGIKTGRNLQRDQQLINDLAPIYEPIAKKVNEYSRRLLQYSVDSGLISKDLANELIKKYPDYVPLQRVFNELEKGTVRNFNPRGVASLSKQTVVQRLQGSEREIASPTESLLLKTQDAFNQGERNKAGRMLAQMSKLKEFNTLIKEVTNGTVPKNSFSYIENGVKRTFETTPEIAAAAKSLNSEQMGLLGKIFSIPTRILQLGATGLNLPFVVTNIVKDQITSFINSNKTAQTSLLNPLNFLRALTSAVKHDNLYKEVIREGAGGTSFDIARNTPNLTIDKIRAGRSVASKISYTVRHPEELIRAVENIIGRGEELGRIQNYKGSKQAFLEEGRTVQDATLLAAEQARKNTANFARRGSWGKTLNYLIPFFNAGIQGARQLVTSFARNPKETTAKVTVALFMPVTAATLWNTSEPDRKLAYDDISKYEKESNIILIPPNPTKDDKGRWNVIKIPIPPGLSNLTSLVRRPLEQMQGLDPVKFSEMAGNIITASTSIDVTSPNKLLSSFTPQLLKPGIESSLNKNLYTGRDIVPTSLQNLPPAEQFKPTTSGTARKIGMLTNISPLKIENAVRTSAGGVGSQLLNISDQILAKSGIIPEDQIGGENPIENINRRFSKAYGGNIEDRQYSQLDPYRADDIRNRIESKGAVEKLSKKLDSLSPVERKNYLVNAIKSGELDKEGIKKLISYKQEQALGRTSIEDSLIRLTVKSRAKYIKDQMKGLSPESKKALLLNYAKKKILTKDVLKEIINSN